MTTQPQYEDRNEAEIDHAQAEAELTDYLHLLLESRLELESVHPTDKLMESIRHTVQTKAEKVRQAAEVLASGLVDVGGTTHERIRKLRSGVRYLDRYGPAKEYWVALDRSDFPSFDPPSPTRPVAYSIAWSAVVSKAREVTGWAFEERSVPVSYSPTGRWFADVPTVLFQGSRVLVRWYIAQDV